MYLFAGMVETWDLERVAEEFWCEECQNRGAGVFTDCVCGRHRTPRGHVQKSSLRMNDTPKTKAFRACIVKARKEFAGNSMPQSERKPLILKRAVELYRQA